jgi:hypothetical protein
LSKRWFAILFLFLLPVPAYAAEAPARWVVVTAPAFKDAVKPLCEQRKAQGLDVVVIQTTDVLTPREIRAGKAEKLRGLVHKKARAGRGRRYLLLVGAADAAGLKDVAQVLVPPLSGTVSRMKGQLSDNGYGTLGKELMPEVAVGRLPARSVEEARQMVAKTLAYENDKRPGSWRRRVTFLGGLPCFGALMDRMVEKMAFDRVAGIDPTWSGRVIYHNPSSPYTLPGDQLQKRALEYVQAGQAVTLYMGHSSAGGFFAGFDHYLDRGDWARLKIARGPGIFVSFGCFGCQLKGRDGEGYGVAAVRNPGGPVAVIGSLGEAYATMVLPAADGFSRSFFAAKPPERLGEAWLCLKAEVAKGKINDSLFALLNLADGNAKIPKDVQRREHLEMFVLLGDPALRLPVLPADIRLASSDAVAPGKTVTVTGRVPKRLEGARVRLTLDRPLDSKPVDLQPVPAKSAAARARAELANHERANRFSLLTQQLRVKDGRFSARLALPAKLPWPRLTVRVYAHTDRAEGMGVLVLGVKKP